MAKNSNKTYWPHMIVGFLLLAITLSYWTIKAASSMPVQETNDYMLKYQISDITINEIMESKILFDKKYDIALQDVEMVVVTDNIHSNRLQGNKVKLAMGKNSFAYLVTDKAGKPISDLNVSFLLTRPHTVVDDQMIEVVEGVDGRYTTPELNITKAGRYTLKFRAISSEGTGYSSDEAYLRPVQ